MNAPKWKPAAGSPHTLHCWFICNRKQQRSFSSLVVILRAAEIRALSTIDDGRTVPCQRLRASVTVCDETEGKENRCHPPRSSGGNPCTPCRSMKSQCEPYRAPTTDRARLGKRRRLVAQSGGSRGSLDRGKAVRVTFNERKTLGALASSPSLPAFLANPTRLSPSPAARPENGSRSRFHTSPPLFLYFVSVSAPVNEHLHNTAAERASKYRTKSLQIDFPLGFEAHVPIQFLRLCTENFNQVKHGGKGGEYGTKSVTHIRSPRARGPRVTCGGFHT